MTTGDESDAEAGAPSGGEMWGDLFLARLTPETRSGLSPDQLDDIKRVAAAVAPSRHQVDWRFSLPASLGGKRFYGVLLAGADRRGPRRQAQDRMMRRQYRRRAGRSSVQALAVGFALVALVLMMLVGIVHADEAKSEVLGIEGADNRTPIETEVWPWTALGRVNREVGGHCTGALIAPDLVLTAAHCLYNFKDGRWTIPMEVHFVAGYHRGAFRDHAKAVRFDLSPTWVPERKDQSNIGNDWAIVQLEHSLAIEPVRLSSRTFPQMKRAADGGELTIAGYNGDFAEILTQHHGCRLMAETAGGRLMLHDCDATFGSSGAPLLLMTPEGTEIVGVQSAIVELPDGRDFGAAVAIAAIRKAAQRH